MNRGIRFVLFGAFAIGVLGQGCQRHADPAMVATLDSMLVRLDSLNDTLAIVDVGLCKRIDSTFERQRPGLELLFADTLERGTAFLAGNYYRAMTRSLARVMRNHDRLHDRIDSSRSQLKALRHDVDRGLLDETARRTYLDQERMELEEIERGAQFYMNSYHAAVYSHADSPRIDSLLRTATP